MVGNTLFIHTKTHLREQIKAKGNLQFMLLFSVGFDGIEESLDGYNCFSCLWENAV